jgi:hypothetical protein
MESIASRNRDVRDIYTKRFIIDYKLYIKSENTHLRAVLPVSISQVKGLREKLRCVQLPASACDAWRWNG